MLRRPLYFRAGRLNSKPGSEGRSWEKLKAAISHSKELFIIIELLVMILALPLHASGNETSGDNSRFQIKYRTTEDGLPQHQISCLKQTHDGYLWIGTHSGLSRFDGFHFTRFDESTTPEIINESIDALAEDSEGTLWI